MKILTFEEIPKKIEYLSNKLDSNFAVDKKMQTTLVNIDELYNIIKKIDKIASYSDVLDKHNSFTRLLNDFKKDLLKDLEYLDNIKNFIELSKIEEKEEDNG